MVKFSRTSANSWEVYLWSDLKFVIGPEVRSHRPSSVIIESLLLTLLADKIREGLPYPDWKMDLYHSEYLHLNFQERIITPGMVDEETLAPENLIDYVLWYGLKSELETNLLVMKTGSPVLESENLLRNMARIHNARKIAKRDAVINGIMTDGSKWVFMHLTNNSRVRKSCREQIGIFATNNLLVHYQASRVGDRATADYGPDSEYLR
jgi:hypothetical protein